MSPDRAGTQQKEPSGLRYLGPHLLVGFLVAFGASVGFGLLADEVFERPRILPIDASARALAASIATPALTSLMRFLSDCGKPLVVGVLTILLAIYLLFAHSRRRLVELTAAMVGGGALNTFLKLHFHRLRPESTLAAAPGYGFPSGHAIGSLLFYGSLGYVLYFTFENRRILRAAAVTFSIFAVLAVGVSRVYLGVHYLTDVVAGWLAGLLWLGICVGTTEGWIHWRDRAREREARGKDDVRTDGSRAGTTTGAP